MKKEILRTRETQREEISFYKWCFAWMVSLITAVFTTCVALVLQSLSPTLTSFMSSRPPKQYQNNSLWIFHRNFVFTMFLLSYFFLSHRSVTLSPFWSSAKIFRSFWTPALSPPHLKHSVGTANLPTFSPLSPLPSSLNTFVLRLWP